MGFIDKYIGLHVADICTLSVYLIGITVLGLWMGKTIHNTTDFFVGGRRFGKLLSTFFAFGAGTHSDQAVSVAAKTYKVGMSGIWYQWLWLFVTPFYWLITPIYRRCRAITTGDYFEIRFSRSVAMLFVFVGIFNLMVNIGTMLTGSGAVIDATTGGTLNHDVAILVMTALFVAYGVVGGLAAAVVTDFVQGLLTIVFSFILLPFAIYHIGGFEALHDKVAQAFAEQPVAGLSSASDLWSLKSPGEITLFYIVVIAINALIGVVAQAQSLPGGNASRTDREAQFGAVAGNMIKRFCTVAWCLTGMCAIAMYPGLTADAEIAQVFGKVAHELLPMILPGLIGVFIASLLASIMSSCDAFMVTCSGLFTQNLYRPLTRGLKSEGHYVNVGRIAAAVVVSGGVLMAYQLESVLHGLELFWKISAMMGIAFWVGLIWRRATSAGAWAGTLLAFGMLLFTSDISFANRELWSFSARIAPRLPDWMLWEGKLYLPVQMLMYLSAGFGGIIIVSLLTARPDQARMDRFYGVIRTPVEPDEVIEAPFTLPRGVQPAPNRKLIDHPDFELQKPTARGIIGFVVIAAIAAALIGAVMIIVRIGA